MSKKKQLLVLSGPTGSGKTSLSIPLAQQLHAPILSADSRQFYREIPIGTAAPTPQELAAAPHYLVGHLSIHDDYNVYRYEHDALTLLEELFETQSHVLLVGGSGMYIDALCNGIDNIPDTDPEIRRACVEKFEQEGLDAIRFELSRIDPISYRQVDLKNPKRILRALEVSLSSGKPYSSFRTATKKERNFEIVRIVITLPRELLYERINQRVDLMIAAGLEEEARNMHPYKNLNALKTVGYSEFFEYFEGNITRDEAIDLIKRNSRRYAKRQLSWFGRDNSATWFESPTSETLMQYILQQKKTN